MFACGFLRRQARIRRSALVAVFIALAVPLLAQQAAQPGSTPDQVVQQQGENRPALDSLPPVPSAALPAELTIPAGTFVTVRLMGSLSSEVNQQGDGFSAMLEQPVVVGGWVVARRGQIAIGHVAEVQKAGRVKGVSSMGLALSDIPVVDGRQLPVMSQLIQTSAGPSKGRDALAVAGTTGLGAAIGGAVDGGAGAGIGAAAGAAAGIAGVLLTPGKPTVFPPETLLTFRLQAPVTINTEHSSVAFLPVSQQDYATAQPRQLQQLPVVPAYPGYPGPPPYPYPYWGGWGFYPTVNFVGFYGGGYGCCYHGGRWH
ncbi:MAG TPA: hypothetical protein VFB24_00335 [Candidatus Binatia bacterium]|nr:hypothetical protein [Candidatus Binatia bacterium]